MIEDKTTLFQNDMAAEKTIDESGGEISLKGVKLSVPSSALSEAVTITLTILNNNSYKAPNLDAKEALLSPLVQCEPHGLQFNKTVYLTLPHCAHNIKKDWGDVSVSATG